MGIIEEAKIAELEEKVENLERKLALEEIAKLKAEINY